MKGRVSLTTRSREVEEKKKGGVSGSEFFGGFKVVSFLCGSARASNRLSLIYANVLLFCVLVMFRR